MTLGEATALFETRFPALYTESEVIRRISELDSRIKTDICDTHGGESVSFTGYTDMTDRSVVLLCGEPYADVYICYAAMHAYMQLGDTVRYNNTREMFTAVYTAFFNAYNRTHTPLGKKLLV